jgi:hypothetical protein
MADLALQFLESGHKIALHDLHMVEIILDEQVGVADAIHNALGLIGRRQDISGDVAGVDRLENQR